MFFIVMLWDKGFLCEKYTGLRTSVMESGVLLSWGTCIQGPVPVIFCDELLGLVFEGANSGWKTLFSVCANLNIKSESKRFRFNSKIWFSGVLIDSIADKE